MIYVYIYTYMYAYIIIVLQSLASMHMTEEVIINHTKKFENLKKI